MSVDSDCESIDDEVNEKNNVLWVTFALTN
jgi:hypothetical protein